jgi:hypothetical protein
MFLGGGGVAGTVKSTQYHTFGTPILRQIHKHTQNDGFKW